MPGPPCCAPTRSAARLACPSIVRCAADAASRSSPPPRMAAGGRPPWRGGCLHSGLLSKERTGQRHQALTRWPDLPGQVIYGAGREKYMAGTVRKIARGPGVGSPNGSGRWRRNARCWQRAGSSRPQPHLAGYHVADPCALLPPLQQPCGCCDCDCCCCCCRRCCC
eukprot:COSAG06_NODE_1502_length_9255_cov_10.094826_3_plen_166_part_00